MQPLSEYELELARLIDKQFTYEEMGRALGKPARTVKSHVDLIRIKLGGKTPLPNKRQIPSVLRELGLL